MIDLLIIILIAGALVYIIRLVPFDDWVKQIAMVLVLLFAVIAILTRLPLLGLYPL